ncbi:ABC transporter substrate-binding protein [Alicyclobacillus sp. ALC3]|uniref:ABC transporter substrate-binding protein n=1 Tax=Alicyclobacillus sp. ALC3 TaxID=2796143 RepID=UPI00237934EE|nr:ABC transporter substrate-binding protein [Alicyclobacillus sp. ALC3]WDL96877.1 ABC transporter substrate-binding protein [Alicyclobacillus sp. ALC3]
MQSNIRIASLCPSNTELLCALGLGDHIAGVDLYSDYPEHVVARLPKLGPDLDIDIDALTALRPDLVVSSLSVPGMEKVVEAVQHAGLTQVTLSPHSFEDVLQDASRIADALPASVRKEIDVQSLVDVLRGRLERVTEATAPLHERPSVYIEWWPNPVFSPGRDNWLTELCHRVGARNIFADRPGAQVQDDGQQVLAAQPDVMLACWTGIPQHKVPLEKIKRRSGWQATPAFCSQHLFVLSEGLYCRPSPRLFDGLEQLLGLLHPEVAKGLQLAPPAVYGPIRDWNGDWLQTSW